ncbi:1-acyl-sn-glycerol-3-phosphate acyltransferase [Mesomycoplasma ovipneumoniae]|uniref:lysophospholipid acyltransferase family protein n=1 Tax=Mesomycoplasma ovipneumoniae TaxID=29562 RepID=UPI002963DFD3|nr:hypothetical protein [Mesomycoplasma ovipneumoniae]MDW2928838.1 1-acyl-sn-glycerol-3-phosphate acyltransferase [Mesomycoplasma ovipneumoniae]
MIIKLRIAIFSIIWLFKIRKIRSVWKKYCKKKVELSPQYRSDLVLSYSKFILKLFGIKIKVFGYENLPKNSSILISNQNQFSDHFALFSALENPSKAEEDFNPIVSFFLEKKRYSRKNKWIFGSLDSQFLAEDEQENLKKFQNFLKSIREKRAYGVIFAKENLHDTELNFPIEIFETIKESGLAIVPVSIKVVKKNTDKNQTKKFKNIEIFIHKPIKPGAVISQTSKSLSLATKRTIIDFYKGEK